MRGAALLVLAACTSQVKVPQARFVNAPPVDIVDDRRDVATSPKPRKPKINLTQLDGMFLNPLGDTLAVPKLHRALGVNSIDEVPDSTWFTNRIGVRVLTPDEIRRGPEVVGSPEPHVPWKVKSTKVGGTAVGFVIEDARGEKFLLKFDPIGHSEVETGASAITNRLLWAVGYNVPEDYVVYFDRKDLVAKDPKVARQLEGGLAKIEVAKSGKIRGSASRMLDGKWLGGHPAKGVRTDDPNDRIAHERRRDLRGAYSVFSWLDHVDVKEGNTLDMWVEQDGRHYVAHYQIDFGKSLGAMAAIHHNPRSGYEYAYDFRAMFDGAIMIGIPERAWERRQQPPLRGIGMFDAATYQPGAWKPNTPSYLPLRTADRIDKFWGAKLVVRFTREQIAAAVDAGRLTDPRAASYLVDTLVARQRATARYWFQRVNPLDRFEVHGGTLCFTDLALEHGLAARDTTRYAVTSFDTLDRPRSETFVMVPQGARSCTLPLDDSPYQIIRIETRRPPRDLATYVHVAPDPRTRAPRVIGVWRE